MHINTAVTKHILPLLSKYDGQPAESIPFGDIAEQIKQLTGKGVMFCAVLPNAVKLARMEYKEGKTFSFNIRLNSECLQDLESSSPARRERFGHLVSSLSIKAEERLCVLLDGVYSKTCFTINITRESGRVYFVAIIGYYGNSINSWCERAQVKETVGVHSFPSTHYMSKEGAKDFVFILDKVVHLSAMI